MECHGLQCGFCTPGMMLTARALLEHNPHPSEHEIREAISGQLCRCTGYKNIVASIQWAADHQAAPEPPPGGERPDGRHRGAPDRLRPAAAQGGPALHPRPGQLRRRHRAARDAARRRPAQPARARAHRLDRHVGRPGAPQGPARSSPARTSRASPRLDADADADVEAVLATDKVRFQHQEVAFVVAEDRYSARDALELIDVEYEPLPVDGRRQEGARPGRAGRARRDRGQDRQPHLRLGVRRPAATDAVFADAEVVVARTSSIRARTRRRWRPAARWPTTTRSRAR